MGQGSSRLIGRFSIDIFTSIMRRFPQGFVSVRRRFGYYCQSLEDHYRTSRSLIHRGLLPGANSFGHQILFSSSKRLAFAHLSELSGASFRFCQATRLAASVSGLSQGTRHGYHWVQTTHLGIVG